MPRLPALHEPPFANGSARGVPNVWTGLRRAPRLAAVLGRCNTPRTSPTMFRRGLGSSQPTYPARFSRLESAPGFRSSHTLALRRYPALRGWCTRGSGVGRVQPLRLQTGSAACYAGTAAGPMATWGGPVPPVAIPGALPGSECSGSGACRVDLGSWVGRTCLLGPLGRSGGGARRPAQLGGRRERPCAPFVPW